jgi:hypothetical protein
MSKMNKCKQCDFKCHDYAFMAEHVARMHTTNTQPDNSDLGLVSETEYTLLPVDTQQSGGDELENYFVETIARYTNAPRIPELAAMLARYVQAHTDAAVKAARIDERENMKFIDWHSDPPGQETFIPFTQYRYTGDGLLLNWEDRTQQLKPQAGEGGEV